MKSHMRTDGIMMDFCDTGYFKEHPLFSLYPDALQIQLYYDDLEVCNPLGSKTKTHKIGMKPYTFRHHVTYVIT